MDFWAVVATYSAMEGEVCQKSFSMFYVNIFMCNSLCIIFLYYVIVLLCRIQIMLSPPFDIIFLLCNYVQQCM